MTFPYGEPIDVVTPAPSTTVDGAGNMLPGTTASVTYVGAFDPAIGYETANGLEDRVSTQPQAYLPYGAVVTTRDVLVIRGLRYEVDGEPGVWRNPFTGWDAGVQVPLRKATG